MSNKKTKSQRAQRKQRKKNQKTIIGIVVVAATAILIIGTIVSSTKAPKVTEERLDLDPVLGNSDATVTIVEYGSYSCRACRQWHLSGTIEQILAAYPDDVNFIFRDNPIITPAYDQMAANAAQCALDQGNEAFWTMHNALYTIIPSGSSENMIIQTGVELGLDEDALHDCVKANTHQKTVNYDFTRASQLGLRSAPVFFVNDQQIFSASPDLLMEAINRELGG